MYKSVIRACSPWSMAVSRETIPEDVEHIWWRNVEYKRLQNAYIEEFSAGFVGFEIHVYLGC